MLEVSLYIFGINLGKIPSLYVSHSPCSQGEVKHFSLPTTKFLSDKVMSQEGHIDLTNWKIRTQSITWQLLSMSVAYSDLQSCNHVILILNIFSDSTQIVQTFLINQLGQRLQNLYWNDNVSVTMMKLIIILEQKNYFPMVFIKHLIHYTM